MNFKGLPQKCERMVNLFSPRLAEKNATAGNPWVHTVIHDDSKRTLPIAIAGFFGQYQFTQ